MRPVISVVACGLALAACTSGVNFLTPAPATLTLRMESEPAGAEARVSANEACRTPCELPITAPSGEIDVTFTLQGYESQVVPVRVLSPAESGSSGPEFYPNPAFAELEAAAPAPGPVRRPAKKAPAKKATAPKAAPKAAPKSFHRPAAPPAAASEAPASAAPSSQPPASSPFPPPPAVSFPPPSR